MSEYFDKIKPIFFILPALTFAVLFFIIPFILLFYVSFTQGSSYFFQPIFTLENYVKIATNYIPDFRNTLMLAALSATLDVIVGYPYAYLLLRKIRFLSDFFRSILMVPLLGELYIAYGFWWLFLPKGPFSSFLEAIGISPFTILYTPVTAALALAIYTLPFAVLQMGINISQIDPVLEEASSCLGANRLKRFIHILLPLSLPGLMSGWFMAFGWNIGAYAIPYLMGGVIVGQRVLSIQIRMVGLLMMNYGLAAALASALVIISLIFTFISLKVSRGVLI
ncbi:MAG: ABC transporter permease subunit [Nitrososphaeria archaeon]